MFSFPAGFANAAFQMIHPVARAGWFTHAHKLITECGAHSAIALIAQIILS